MGWELSAYLRCDRLLVHGFKMEAISIYPQERMNNDNYIAYALG
jgi:hypothetical protein